VTTFGDYQYEIYLAGLDGRRPALPMTVADMEAAARAVLTPEAYAYVAGSAGTESTAAANLESLARWQIMPRHLRGVTRRDLAVELLGLQLPAPVLLAPVGVLGIVHADAERAVARAAASLGVPMVLSTVSSSSLEAVAAELAEASRPESPTPAWFQLYWPKERTVAASFVHRAEAAGYRAIVVTLDTWQLAWRPRDLAAGYLPFLTGEGMGTYFSDPVFIDLLEGTPTEDRDSAVLRWAGMFGDPSLGWDDLVWLREQTTLPIVLKGICHPDDARLAVDAGMDGIVVSNHGGRQVDGGRAAIDCLPGVVAAAGLLPVLFDSGIRSGADIVKALALGARAVLVGRPYVWGLAVAGEDGVRHVLRCLLADLELTMGLCGHATPATLNVDVVAQHGGR
jgi:lactate 2-monooxygenase